MNSQSMRGFLVVLLVVLVAFPMLAQSKSRSSSTRSKSGSKTTKAVEPSAPPQRHQ